MTTMTDNAESPMRLPAEWEPQKAVLLAWPHKDTDWAYMLDDAQRCISSIIRAVIPYAPVIVVAPEPDAVYDALPDCDRNRLYVASIPTNDTWTRDYGVITTVTSDGRYILNDYCFNGWGMKFAADRDNLVTRGLYFANLLKGTYKNNLDFVLEGGSIESDGRGTLLTTRHCLMSPNRNGAMTRRMISSRLKRDFGVRKVLWLESGHLEGDDTDGHIDTLARLAPDNSIIYVGCDNPADSHYAELREMRNELVSLRNAQGEPFNLFEVPLPDPIYEADGHRLPATYANFLIINGAVIVPVYNQPKKDRLACMIIQAAFPDYTIVPVDCTALIRQHGSLHCATMQLPEANI